MNKKYTLISIALIAVVIAAAFITEESKLLNRYASLNKVRQYVSSWQLVQTTTYNNMDAKDRKGRIQNYFVEKTIYTANIDFPSAKSKLTKMTDSNDLWTLPPISKDDMFTMFGSVAKLDTILPVGYKRGMGAGTVTVTLLAGKPFEMKPGVSYDLNDPKYQTTVREWSTISIEEYRPRIASDPPNQPKKGIISVPPGSFAIPTNDGNIRSL